jgi:DNA primase
MSSIDDIKAAVDIVELVSETVKLRRSGKSYTGFCPFHPNSRTPAFVVFPDSGTWRCFGQCNEGGDIFKFVMKKEGWDFSQALHALAERAGIKLEAPTPERQAEDEHTEHLRALLEEAVTFYRHHLTQSPAGKEALVYLGKRGLQPATIETFGLGYAPNSWDAALQYFSGKGYSQQDLLDCGLVTEREGREGVYDRFRNRIMFPIRDGAGRMAGFGARILDPQDIPKFLNSPQTALFDKGRLLYALDLARKAIRAQDQVVIVEGYLDVIALHQAGFSNTVSPMGTALTEDQLRYLKKFTRRIVLALDADAAGEKATLRGLELARQTLDHTDEIVFDARGLLHHEARLQADVRVTTLPPGADPDEVVLRDPQEWQRILEAARPIVTHVMETLAAGRDLDDPKVKSAIAAQVLPLIEDVPNLVERDAYRQRLARLLKVDEHALLSTKAAPPTRQRRSQRSPVQAAPPLIATTSASQRAHKLELHCLRLLLRQPDAFYFLDRALQNAGLARFEPHELAYTDHQMLARLIQQSLAQDQLDPHQYIAENVSESLADLLRQMQEPIEHGEPSTEKLIEDLIGTVLRLRQVRITEEMNQLRYMQEDLQQGGDMRLESFDERVIWSTQVLARIERANGQPLQLD